MAEHESNIASSLDDKSSRNLSALRMIDSDDCDIIDVIKRSDQIFKFSWRNLK